MVTLLQDYSFADWRGLRVSGRLDSFNDRQSIQQMKGHIDGANKVVLELSACDFMSLQFLKFLSELNKDLQERGGELALLNLNHQIKRQIEIFLGTRSFRIYRDLRELNNGYFREPRSEHLVKAELSARG